MSDREGLPGIRHKLAERLFHWLMAASVVALLATAFLPIVGIRFAWLPLHWTAGVALTLLVLFHIGRAVLVNGLAAMSPRGADLVEVGRAVLGRPADDLAPAKYDAFQKGIHVSVLLAVLVLVATGLAMLVKIDTSFWKRDPAVLSDLSWGYIYVAHGAAALVLLFLVILHVYFAILPEHRAFLRAMIVGRGPALARGGKS